MDKALQHQYLEAMGIQRWVPRDAVMPEPEVIEPAVSAETDVSTTATGEIASLDWPELQAMVQQCQQCALHSTRTQTVFGVGNQQADWLIIGEAPGAEEDKQGEPFVGSAGLLLTAMLNALDLQRQQVYIANMIKCRPPGNRDPHSDEIQQCLSYLHRQIALLQPKLILVVGRIAAQSLLGTSQPLGKLRGRVHTLPETAIPLIVTYHPAYLLRSPHDKRKAWQDLCLAKQQLENDS